MWYLTIDKYFKMSEVLNTIADCRHDNISDTVMALTKAGDGRRVAGFPSQSDYMEL